MNNEVEILARYRRLPYKRRVEKVRDEHEGAYYVCRYPELPGLVADGETRAEAIRNADDAFDDYILAKIHFGDPIPEPEGAQRVARALHLADHAPKAAVTLAIEVVNAKVSVKRDMQKIVVKALKRPERVATGSDAETRFQEKLAVAGG